MFIKKFRFRKNSANNAAIRESKLFFSFPRTFLIVFFFLLKVKIDREKQLVILDEEYDDITLDELSETMSGHQPRFIIYSYKMIHEDQRVSYPMCFIFYTPRDSQVGNLEFWLF